MHLPGATQDLVIPVSELEVLDCLTQVEATPLQAWRFRHSYKSLLSLL